MKKSFKLKELDCANCAAKMERGINKIKGVNSATVSFMTSRLTIDAEDAAFDDILKEASRLIKKIEPDCEIVCK